MTARDRTGSERRDREVVVQASLDGERADVIVAAALGMTVRDARTLFESGHVRAAERRVPKGERLGCGVVLHVRPPLPWLVAIAPDGLELISHDEDLVVVSKPAGLPSHPLRRGEGGTAADGVAAWFPECATASLDPREAGLVHRLDTFTSGLLAAARSRNQWTLLRAAFATEHVRRSYLALVEGSVSDMMIVDAPIAHDPRDARRMSVIEKGSTGRGAPRAATTTVIPVVSTPNGSLVLVRIQGGRRHQVRVHLAHLGSPLVGDVLYGGRPCAARAGHLLHAVALSLPARKPLVAAPPLDFGTALRERGLPLEGITEALRRLRPTGPSGESR